MQFVPSERLEKTRGFSKLDVLPALVGLDDLLASIAFGSPFAVVHQHPSSVSSDTRGSILRAVYT